jgi:NAD+ kinase
LGFLTYVSHTDIEASIDCLHNGNYSIEERSIIEVTTSEGELRNYPYALNEIAVMTHDSSSMMTLITTLNGGDSIIYQADGLIVATPSGSTGYSLSVGGPIIAPDAGVMVLTPIASHSLGARPIVVNDDTEVTIKVNSRSHNFLIAIDGRNESCPEEYVLTIKKAPYKQRLIRCNGCSFIKNLHDKMMWGADTRE